MCNHLINFLLLSFCIKRATMCCRSSLNEWMTSSWRPWSSARSRIRDSSLVLRAPTEWFILAEAKLEAWNCACASLSLSFAHSLSQLQKRKMYILPIPRWDWWRVIKWPVVVTALGTEMVWCCYARIVDRGILRERRAKARRFELLTKIDSAAHSECIALLFWNVYYIPRQPECDIVTCLCARLQEIAVSHASWCLCWCYFCFAHALHLGCVAECLFTLR